MKIINYARCVAVVTGLCASPWIFATPLTVSAPVNGIPPNIISTANKPMMMLAASKDHTLFGAIYTDFEDIDGDGLIDTTFIPTFKYYGYFDATKCYTYVSGNSRFEPARLASTSTVDSKIRYSCGGSGEWSGNFLNWATMTRLDVIRKMLYGGKRSADANTTTANSSGTVLERTNLTQDSHSFVKYYNGPNIRDYTPFTEENLKKEGGKNPDVYAGLTICNRSDANTGFGNPVIRLAKGNYLMWATVERPVCAWSDVSGEGGGLWGPSWPVITLILLKAMAVLPMNQPDPLWPPTVILAPLATRSSPCASRFARLVCWAKNVAKLFQRVPPPITSPLEFSKSSVCSAERPWLVLSLG